MGLSGIKYKMLSMRAPVEQVLYTIENRVARIRLGTNTNNPKFPDCLHSIVATLPQANNSVKILGSWCFSKPRHFYKLIKIFHPLISHRFAFKMSCQWSASLETDSGLDPRVAFIKHSLPKLKHYNMASIAFLLGVLFLGTSVL